MQEVERGLPASARSSSCSKSAGREVNGQRVAEITVGASRWEQRGVALHLD